MKLKYYSQSARGIAERDTIKHYFTEKQYIYSDKIAKLTCKCNDASGGLVIKRLSRIYSDIFIDEAQDLAGYDFEIIRALLNSDINIQIVCDPRQSTYTTNNASKNRKYKNALLTYLDEKYTGSNLTIDDSTLNKNYRSVDTVCRLSDKLFPNFPITNCTNRANTTKHYGIFAVRPDDVNSYICRFDNIVQLRWNKKNKSISTYAPVMNFGESKGLTFDRVIIYPTNDMIKWINDDSAKLSAGARAKFYVALTRARYSTAIVMNFDDTFQSDYLIKFIPPKS